MSFPGVFTFVYVCSSLVSQVEMQCADLGGIILKGLTYVWIFFILVVAHTTLSVWVNNPKYMNHLELFFSCLNYSYGPK